MFFLLVLCMGLTGCNTQDVPATIDPLMVRYGQVAQEISELVEKEGAGSAAQFLQETVEKEPALEDICHGLAHEIGEQAYEKDGFEDALRFEYDVCGSGYLHGVIEAYLADVEDLDAVLLTLCEPGAGKCFHGIGHGLMYRSLNDLPGSIALCDRFEARAARVQCYEGVFMENVEVDPTTHPSEYLKADDPYFPCRNQNDIAEGVCAFYMPRYYLRLYPRAYEDALAYCDTIPEGPRDACIKGVGDSVMKQNINDPLWVENFCENVDESKRRFCIEGLVSYYIVHHASSSKGLELCELLKEENRASCQKVVSESREAYPE